jgi:nicotinamidase/pyrazinamidase
MTTRRTHLLVIDPQNDFCDLPEAYRPVLPDGRQATPALPVSGAHRDLVRLAQIVDEGGAGLSAMTITLDSHHRLDIAHPPFWRAASGEPVPPFTTITADDVERGRYLTRAPEAQSRALAYLRRLEQLGRYRHMVWPVHCEIGTWGHDVHPTLRAAYNRWEERWLRSVGKITKGENRWTEHYSALRAEVPDEADPATGTHVALLEEVRRADQLYIAGEASSHCVKATTEHLVEALDEREVKRLVLVTDAMSPVAGFEAAHDAFLRDMQARGVRLASAEQVVGELRANAA